MKVVHLCLNGIYTEGWNYQENLLTKYQKKNGNEVIIITSKWMWNDKGQLSISNDKEYINKAGVKVIRLSLYGPKFFNKKIKIYKKLYKAIESESPDILFIHDPANFQNKLIIKYIKRNPNLIIYADNHADLTNTGTNRISKCLLPLWGRLARKLVPYTKKFYGVLPVRVDFLTNIYRIPKEKCELLVMGADDELVSKYSNESIISSNRIANNIDNDDFLIVTGGKIDKWKHQTLLLMEAVRNINNPRIKLLVFGSVSEEIKRDFLNLIDGNIVTYLGWADSETSYKYFSMADLVVFPGRHSVFWEQVAAQGIPMICRFWPGSQHIDVGGNVCFLKEDSQEEIQDCVMKIFNDESLYKKMKLSAKKNGMKYFSYSQIALNSIS